MVTDIYMSVLPAILPLLILNNGYSYFTAGLLITAYNITSSFTQPVIGWLSDKTGLSISITFSLLISAVFVAMMGIVQTYYIIMLLAVLAAFGHACFHPSALTLVSRLCTNENRGQLTSYFVVGGNFGYAIGPVLASGLVWGLGLHGLLLLILPAVAMALALKYALPGGLTKPAAPVVMPLDENHGANSKMPFIILMIATILRAWAVFAAITFLPLYLVSQGYEIFMASMVITLMLLAGVTGQVVGGYFSDRYGRKEFMIVGLGLSIPPFCLFMLTGGLISIISLLLFGFFLWSTFAVAVAISHELLPRNVGLASGIMLGFAIGFGGLGVAVNGIIADHYSLAAALGAIPISIAGAILLMSVLPYPWKTLTRGHTTPLTQ